MISVNYSITKADYINYYAYVLWDAPENRKKRLTYYGRQLLPILVFLFAFYYTGIFERNSTFILLIIGFIFLTSALSLFGVRSNTVKQAEKITEDPGNASIFIEQALIVTESGIHLKNEFTDTNYRWSAFTKKQESNDYYFLFINSIQALIIPKRIFIHESEKIMFDKLLAQHLSLDADIGYLIKK